MKTSFDHEKLDVYQDTIRFVCIVEALAKPLQAPGIRVQEARVQAGIVI